MLLLITLRRCVVKAADIGSSSCSGLLNLFLSEPFCLLLSHLTGLHLSDRFLDPHTPAPQDEVGGASNSRQCIAETPVGCHGDVFLWKPGCYTLMSDDQSCLIKYTLEAAMFFNVQGNIIYIYICTNDGDSYRTCILGIFRLMKTYVY